MAPTMIMHPYRTDLVGMDISGFKDSKGKYLFNEFVKVVQEKGGGYVDYMWQWKDDPAKIVPKMSYVKGFTPWGWIIGTGLYIDDIHAEIAKIRNKLTIISLAILLVVSLLALYSIRQTMKADRERLGIFLEREDLMKSLEVSKERYRNLIETTSDWIWECDAEGKYIYSSPRVTNLLGYLPAEVVGKTLVDIVSPQQVKAFRITYQKLMSTGKNINGLENICLGKSGQIVVLENNAVPIFDDQGALLEAISNPFADAGHGAEHRTARMLIDKKVDLVIAGRFGSAMRQELSERGIKMSERSGKVEDALAAVTP